MFKPFYRPGFARQRETGGVGLGLAIVRELRGSLRWHRQMRQPLAQRSGGRNWTPGGETVRRVGRQRMISYAGGG